MGLISWENDKWSEKNAFLTTKMGHIRNLKGNIKSRRLQDYAVKFSEQCDIW